MRLTLSYLQTHSGESAVDSKNSAHNEQILQWFEINFLDW